MNARCIVLLYISFHLCYFSAYSQASGLSNDSAQWNISVDTFKQATHFSDLFERFYNRECSSAHYEIIHVPKKRDAMSIIEKNDAFSEVLLNRIQTVQAGDQIWIIDYRHLTCGDGEPPDIPENKFMFLLH